MYVCMYSLTYLLIYSLFISRYPTTTGVTLYLLDSPDQQLTKVKGLGRLVGEGWRRVYRGHND